MYRPDADRQRHPLGALDRFRGGRPRPDRRFGILRTTGI